MLCPYSRTAYFFFISIRGPKAKSSWVGQINYRQSYDPGNGERLTKIGVGGRTKVYAPTILDRGKIIGSKAGKPKPKRNRTGDVKGGRSPS